MSSTPLRPATFGGVFLSREDASLAFLAASDEAKLPYELIALATPSERSKQSQWHDDLTWACERPSGVIVIFVLHIRPICSAKVANANTS
jgi:hypothetical protein